MSATQAMKIALFRSSELMRTKGNFYFGLDDVSMKGTAASDKKHY